MYTLFNLAQFLGFVEVVRREGPREDAFLQAGNPQGSDTLATLVEGLRFVMSAASGNLVVSIHPATAMQQCLLPATSHMHDMRAPALLTVFHVYPALFLIPCCLGVLTATIKIKLQKEKTVSAGT